MIGFLEQVLIAAIQREQYSLRRNHVGPYAAGTRGRLVARALAWSMYNRSNA